MSSFDTLIAKTFAEAFDRFGDFDKAMTVTKAIFMAAYDEINAEAK
jgi:hypothetical protein